MVISVNEAPRYRVTVSNGPHEIVVDTTVDKGGGNTALTPHELLEAALASCLCITIRSYADKKGLSLSEVTARVTVDRSQPGQTIFNYSYSFAGDLTDQQREGVDRIATNCPVQKSLANAISFVSE